MIEVGAAVKYLGQKWTVKETKKVSPESFCVKSLTTVEVRKSYLNICLSTTAPVHLFQKQKGITV